MFAKKNFPLGGSGNRLVRAGMQQEAACVNCVRVAVHSLHELLVAGSVMCVRDRKSRRENGNRGFRGQCPPGGNLANTPGF